MFKFHFGEIFHLYSILVSGFWGSSTVEERDEGDNILYWDFHIEDKMNENAYQVLPAICSFVFPSSNVSLSQLSSQWIVLEKKDGCNYYWKTLLLGKPVLDLHISKCNGEYCPCELVVLNPQWSKMWLHRFMGKDYLAFHRMLCPFSQDEPEYGWGKLICFTFSSLWFF